MKRRRLFFALLCATLSLLGSWAQKTVVWNDPTTEFGNAYFDGFFYLSIDITKVELKANETAVYATIRQRSDIPGRGTYPFTQDTHLLADGKRYPVLSADGITFGTSHPTGKDGKLDIVFHFQPLPTTTRAFDFKTDEAGAGLLILGVQPVEERWKKLFPSYWRDEATGEWKIAFFQDQQCAIYDNKVWKMHADLNSAKDEATITLTRVDEQLRVFVGKNKKGKRTLRVGDKKMALSMITPRFMPVSPKKDNRTDFVNTAHQTDTVTLRGWLKDMPDFFRKGRETFEVGYNDFMKNEPVALKTTLDSMGRFTLKIPLSHACEAFLDWGRCSVHTLLEPGKTYFLLYDFAEGRRFFMGDDVRLQNELLRFPLDWFTLRMEEGEDFDHFLQATDSAVKANDERIDRLCREHPTLSARFRQFTKDNFTAQAARALGQARFYCPDYRLPDHGRQYAYERGWKKMGNAYALHRDWRGFIQDFVGDITQRLPPAEVRTLDFIEDIGENDEDTAFLKDAKAFLDATKARIAAAKSDEEKARIYEETRAQEESVLTRVNALINSPKANGVVNDKLFVAELQQTLHVLDSLNAAPLVKDAFVRKMACDRIESDHKPLSEIIMRDLAACISHASTLDDIREKNAQYLALAHRQIDHLVLKTGDEVEGMKEGAEILRKLTEPYRGKFILLDVWGTWCAPCKRALADSAEEFERLAPYGLQYMYLANNSPHDTWETIIKEYNVAGENVVHFNLPREQQSAIETYLQVTAFPTYKLIDPEGRVLDLKVDPRNLDQTEELLRKLMGK